MITACPPILKTKQLEIGILEYRPGPAVVERACELCGTPIHIGQYQLDHVMTHPETIAVCFACAQRTGTKGIVRVLGAQGGEYLVSQKNVPQKPPLETA